MIFVRTKIIRRCISLNLLDLLSQTLIQYLNFLISALIYGKQISKLVRVPWRILWFYLYGITRVDMWKMEIDFLSIYILFFLLFTFLCVRRVYVAMAERRINKNKK